MSLAHAAHAFQREKKEKKEAPTGTPVLWRDPGGISTPDLIADAGGDEMKPDLTSL